MRYVGRLYRPPSEADAYILQATLGCSWNRCTYCDMYRDKPFAVRELDEILDDIRQSRLTVSPGVDKVFVADGDALIMPLDYWLPILDALHSAFPRLRQVSCYAMANNVADKTDEELRRLADAGLSLLYIGPESGDPAVLKRIVKGQDFAAHEIAAQRAKAAGLALSVIFLLGAGGVAASEDHAAGSARLATAMDPEYLAALTLTVIPGTPIHRLEQTGRFELPDTLGLLRELRAFVREASPTDALFRTNHASNYLPIGGRLPKDRDRILTVIDAALAGNIPLRPEWTRGL